MSKPTKTVFLSSECRTAYAIADALNMSDYDAEQLIEKSGLTSIGTTMWLRGAVPAYSIKDADQLIALVKNRTENQRENRGSE